MPYYREQLLSSWPNHMVFDVGAPAAKIDPHILSSFKAGEWGHWGGFGRTPRNVRRNQIENTRVAEKAAASLQAPKFLSEKARESANETEPAIERRISDVADAIGATELANLKADVPVMYRNVEIKYSKFGVDDFDFGSVSPLQPCNSADIA
jgi:PAB-dependent poly(A)-specific ribonuclease subunit 2